MTREPLNVLSPEGQAQQNIVIEVEKLLCAAIGREWSASGISIASLIKELQEASRVKAIEDCANVAEELGSGLDGLVGIRTCTSVQVAEFCRTIAADIRALKGSEA